MGCVLGAKITGQVEGRILSCTWEHLARLVVGFFVEAALASPFEPVRHPRHSAVDPVSTYQVPGSS